MHGICIAILGAESTGKTALAQALAPRLAAETGLRSTWVPEVLRAWCDTHGRTPRRHEQVAIAVEQQRLILEAAYAYELVVCDTTALQTAVYSRLVFQDRNLDAWCAAAHANCAITLLTALDLPWVPDGLQRDGAHVREPVDSALRELLAEHRIPWALVAGQGDGRLQAAVDAVAPQLRRLTTPGQGLFTRLAERDAASPQWVCQACDDPACESALKQRLAAG